MNHRSRHTSLVRSIAHELGFLECGIAKAVPLTEDARRLEQWLQKGYQGSMHYMEHHFDLRIDPTKLVPGAKSVITLLMNYYPETIQQTDGPKISKYAYGKDYHEVIRKKLHEFLFRLESGIGAVAGRGFVDSAPVLERAWATRSGLGWIGKNGNLIHKQSGSFFFIATLITDLELDADTAFERDYCGSCTRCIDACPTQAILPNKVVNGSKCISYYTIELKEAFLEQQLQQSFDQWMFGCDTCQDVCPWNRFSKPTQEAAFTPIPMILDMKTKEWVDMTEEVFKKVFRESPIKRAKYSGLRRNLGIWLNDETR